LSTKALKSVTDDLLIAMTPKASLGMALRRLPPSMETSLAPSFSCAESNILKKTLMAFPR
jgi:hypothetical protein